MISNSTNPWTVFRSCPLWGQIVGWIVLAITIVILAAGCGGSSGTHYSYSKTTRCLKARGFLPTPLGSTVLSGTAGNLAVSFSGAGFPPGRVVAMFAKTRGEADDILAKEKILGKATGTAHVIVHETGNVVYGGGYYPSEVNIVGECLR